MRLKCAKCREQVHFEVALNKRGLPIANCKNCGNYIKALSATELATLVQEMQAEAPETIEPPKAEPAPAKEDRMPCPYCRENYFMRRGRLGTIYTPIEIKFCPLCGRETKPTDRDYR